MPHSALYEKRLSGLPEPDLCAEHQCEYYSCETEQKHAQCRRAEHICATADLRHGKQDACVRGSAMQQSDAEICAVRADPADLLREEYAQQRAQQIWDIG